MKTIILLIVSLMSLSTFALEVNCDVKINNQIIASGKKMIIHDKNEPEGSGHVLIANEGSIKIYVTTYPIEIVANSVERYDDGTEVVMEAKKSNVLTTLLFHQDSASLSTSIDGIKIHVKCTEISPE